MNTTFFDGITANNSNANFAPDLECNGINASSTHSLTVSERMAYDDAVRFPVIDVISFFPNRSSGLGSYVSGWFDDVQIEIVCMKADGEIVEGSAVPPSGKELLDRPGMRFPTANGAGTLGVGILWWISALVVGLMTML
jgi:hypothetical protein